MLTTRHTLGVIVATALMSGCSDDTSSTEDDSMQFAACEGSRVLECDSFEAPLIHDSTDNRRISIDFARLPGTGEGPHEALLLNLGGPGSGIQALGEVLESGESDAVLGELRDRYDIVAFDQRGVGDPLRVDCDALGNAESIPYPQDRSDLQSLLDDTSALAAACSMAYTDQLQWIGSNSVAQDMELLRVALDVPKLNIIGSSFGSRITALYLERYPQTSGRVILDAPLRPGGSIDALLSDRATAQQRNFEQVLDACGTTVSDCDRATVESAFVARVGALSDEGDEETFGAFANLLMFAIEDVVDGEFLAPLLIDYALDGDPAEMFALIEEFGLDDDDEVGTGEETAGNDSITLERAVLCADDAARPDIDSLVSTLAVLNDTSELFAEALLPLAASCVGWPEALNPVADIQTSDAPASLVIGGVGDSLTPIAWATETATAIGGVFLSSDHPGHTTLFERENDCVDAIVMEFLLEGPLPAEGTVCE